MKVLSFLVFLISNRVLKAILAFLYIALFTQNSFAIEIEAEGRYYFPANISEVEACENAFIDARQSAMSQAGLEKGNFSQMDICSENENGAFCTLIQINQSYFDGGYILSEKQVDKRIDGQSKDRECVVIGKFDVQKFRSQPDVNFIVKAELDDRKYYSGQQVKIKGETNQKAYISLVGYSPRTDIFERIVPSSFEPVIEVAGSFQIPSKQNSEKYELYAFIPENDAREEVAEFMILLATKKRFDLLEKSKASDFYKRLDELGRENWRKIELGYTIYRNKVNEKLIFISQLTYVFSFDWVSNHTAGFSRGCN